MNRNDHEMAMARAAHLLPDNARQLVEMLTLATTLKLVDAYGGTHFPIPRLQGKRGSILLLWQRRWGSMQPISWSSATAIPSCMCRNVLQRYVPCAMPVFAMIMINRVWS